jgi:hypothetical protein
VRNHSAQPWSRLAAGRPALGRHPLGVADAGTLLPSVAAPSFPTLIRVSEFLTISRVVSRIWTSGRDSTFRLNGLGGGQGLQLGTLCADLLADANQGGAEGEVRMIVLYKQAADSVTSVPLWCVAWSPPSGAAQLDAFPTLSAAVAFMIHASHERRRWAKSQDKGVAR